MTQIGTAARERRRIGAVAIDVLTEAEAVETVLSAVDSRRPLMVAFANAHSVNLARTDADFAAAMDDALVLNDGIGVDLASKWLFRQRFPGNLNGTDFVPALIAAAQKPLRLFLIGGRPGTAQRAGEILADRFPHVTVVGALDGYFASSAELGQVQQIADAKANLVLLALGQPLQERWAQRHWRSVAGPCLCVGALLDFLAGNVPRAPSLVRRFRLEWLFRLAHEPRRLARRYLIGNATFLVLVLRSGRRTGQKPASRNSTSGN